MDNSLSVVRPKFEAVLLNEAVKAFRPSRSIRIRYGVRRRVILAINPV
jgi:hypothetical protein